MNAIDLEVPTDLWSEDGDQLWLRYDLAENAGKARYVAFKGKGLPVGFEECGVYSLLELRVRVVYCRRGTPRENAYHGWCDGIWMRCTPDVPGAEKFWEVMA